MWNKEQCAIPLKSPHQCAEIRPACLQYPLSHPKKSHPRRFSPKCGKTLDYFMPFRSCPPHNAVHWFTFKLHSFPSFSSVGTKYQSPGILILSFPYYIIHTSILQLLAVLPLSMKTHFMTTKLESLQIHKYFYTLQHI